MYNFWEYLLEGEKIEHKSLWEVTNWDKRFVNVEKTKQKTILQFKHVLAGKMRNMREDTGNIKLLSAGSFDGYTTPELGKDYINQGEVIAIPRGASKVHIKYYKGSFVDGGNILGVGKEQIKTKYIYYFLLTKKKYIKSFLKGVGILHPDMSQILEIKIPIPCPNKPQKSVAIQEKIINILDSFTELTAELTTAIDMNKKQYNYYLNNLLNFDGRDES